MAGAKKIPSTQEHLDIEDIRDNIVILKNGTAVSVLQTTALNFDLLSEDDQDAMIFAFGGLLNSLTYPIQIFIRSKRMDITNYIVKLEDAKRAVQNPNLVTQIEKYENFVSPVINLHITNQFFYCYSNK